MSTQLAEQLLSVEITDPVEAHGLQVFGLRWNPGAGGDYLTLDDSLSAGVLEVTEVSDGGSVPTLHVRNKGDVKVFLMAGEALVGAKQNRVLNTSIMVGPASELPVPVSCVEAGRWAYRGRSFGSGGVTSHSKLRKMMHGQTTESLHHTGGHGSNQSAVWGEVERKLASMGSFSPSSDLNQTYEDHNARLEEVRGQLTPPEGASGVVFAFGGKIGGVDLFDRPDTLVKLWPKLVRAYFIDVLEDDAAAPKGVTREDVKNWLSTAPAARVQAFKSPGLGEDVRLEGSTLVAAGLVVDERPVHVEIFPTEMSA